MARATGSINYLEHRTPLKDESGKYQIHPMFVKQDVVDREKMEKRVRDHCAMNVSSFISHWKRWRMKRFTPWRMATR